MTTYPNAAYKAWVVFRKQIEEACSQIGCNIQNGIEPWFRGESKSTNVLLPSLFRPTWKKNCENNRKAITRAQRKQIWEMESDLFYEFSAQARELFGIIENDWDILFAMQHYDTPTRLLDWTEVLGVALFFATHGNNPKKDDTPCVWVLNPYELNRQSDWEFEDMLAPDNLGWDRSEGKMYTYSDLLAESGLDWDYPVAIYPRQRNARIHAQRGWFTIFGDKYVPLNSLRSSKKYLRQVILQPQAVEYARQFLDDAGFNQYSLFPDLPSLSMHLKKKYNLL